MIQMTFDVPSLHNDKKVPMLDTKVWIDEEDKIYHQFFEKPTKSKMVISKESAMPLSKKIDILSNEVFRRLHNTSHDIEWENKVPILEKFMIELKLSGYSENDRAEILKSGVRRYEELKEKEARGIRPFYSKRNFEDMKRHEEKRTKKTNWFNLKNNNYSTVFFVPPTPNSLLLKMLRNTYQIR